MSNERKAGLVRGAEGREPARQLPVPSSERGFPRLCESPAATRRSLWPRCANQRTSIRTASNAAVSRGRARLDSTAHDRSGGLLPGVRPPGGIRVPAWLSVPCLWCLLVHGAASALTNAPRMEKKTRPSRPRSRESAPRRHHVKRSLRTARTAEPSSASSLKRRRAAFGSSPAQREPLGRQ
jgi:hypothetical protein